MSRVCLLAIWLWITGIAPVFAAMDPKEIEEIKQAAPLHLQGEVVEDKLIKEIDFPGQERVMSVQVSEVVKGSELVEPGDMINIYYTYIPDWLEVEGGAKMEIAVSDRIEIWLEQEGDGWMPAASGDTVTHLFKSEVRPEHMPAPEKPLGEAVLSYLADTPLIVPIALILGIVFGITAYISAKFAPTRS